MDGGSAHRNAYTYTRTQAQRKHKHVYASSGIRTHDPSLLAGETFRILDLSATMIGL
jgi:hypothetical protein